ncbi:MAG: hypothetical protein HeimC3_21690 [Candidatus Heimdallarchaeota archaeon LC_3]|nr:MAG: hypothetical protein HeimC3_21690 [Candidatus Heimdallarchaeota archaeon LC_3]
MAVMRQMNDDLDQLFDYSLPKFFSPEEKSTFIDLIEKCKVALKYLNKDNHENFWDFFEMVITKEVSYRKIILDLNRKAEELAYIKERVSDTIIWKFGLYNHCRIILLQELSNFLTNEFEKALVYKKTSPYIAKNVIRRANDLGTYYLNKFNALNDLQKAEDDNIIEHCSYVIEDSIEIGRNSLKAITLI